MVAVSREGEDKSKRQPLKKYSRNPFKTKKLRVAFFDTLYKYDTAKKAYLIRTSKRCFLNESTTLLFSHQSIIYYTLFTCNKIYDTYEGFHSQVEV